MSIEATWGISILGDNWQISNRGVEYSRHIYISAQWVMHARLCLIITLPRFISSQSLLSVVLLHECNSHLNPFLLLFPLVIAGKIRYRCTPHAHITQTYLFTNLTDAHTTNLKVTSRIILPVLTFCGPCFLA